TRLTMSPPDTVTPRPLSNTIWPGRSHHRGHHRSASTLLPARSAGSMLDPFTWITLTLSRARTIRAATGTIVAAAIAITSLTGQIHEGARLPWRSPDRDIAAPVGGHDHHPGRVAAHGIGRGPFDRRIDVQRRFPGV